MHNVLQPLGPFAAATYGLYRVLFGTSAIVYLLVMIALVAAIVRGRRRAAPAGSLPDVEPDERREKRFTKVVGACVATTVVILFVLLVTDFLAGRRIEALVRPNPVAVTVTGHQWWWDVRYDDSLPSRRFRTANELHVPVGRPVRITLQSNDVIHSFWVPSLNGKRDLIPGHTSELWFQADQPGVYEGQCAEFCGLQHAHMRLEIVAETPEAFDAWRTAQLATPPAPTDTVLAHGREVFLSATCVICHTVAGTPARAATGPDLSHVGARRMIASGSLTNTPEHLAAWVRDPSAVKPGATMPANPMPAGDLAALSAWLASLR